MYEQYEDRIRQQADKRRPEFRSPYQDFRYYSSSVTPGIRLALNVLKPARPSYLLVELHGWHMSMPAPQHRDTPSDKPYLIVQVDMRGRAYSEGMPDCNGLELIDVYDAIRFVKDEYKELLLDPDVVYIEGGSGGGGNVLALVNKFPDLFAAATALYGVSDYAEWYACDRIGEFRDEMDVWIGCAPWEAIEPYEARSGAFLASNQLTPLLLVHGSFDARVPASHSRLYADAASRAGKSRLVRYVEWRGVGGEEHTDRLPDALHREFAERNERHRRSNAVPIEIAPTGTFLVGGYLITKRFAVHMESPDAVARLEYDIDGGQFRLRAKRPYAYRILTEEGVSLEGRADVVPEA
ncbi:alpha/beta hydrolase family protein [Paenibacillus flagellatus]|uniref:Peptidase S9 prolyl oligopeptidase catalytic domain-containing protein n=1 Tax=Paenibacillus flagellatus TaxID=2211139 RepID=A0A2V5L2I1_9BACL|nr:prolyl oligopeptidase family serine peptidase [Paenibacillus flagellatus]PYI56906.1 hypothetical protein DLM86_00180 [Paenibacillus flagellatus]